MVASAHDSHFNRKGCSLFLTYYLLKLNSLFVKTVRSMVNKKVKSNIILFFHHWQNQKEFFICWSYRGILGYYFLCQTIIFLPVWTFYEISISSENKFQLELKKKFQLVCTDFFSVLTEIFFSSILITQFQKTSGGGKVSIKAVLSVRKQLT